MLPPAATEGISPDKSTWWKRLETQNVTSPPLSKPDQAWMDEGLEFVYSREGVSISELNDLFQKVVPCVLLHSACIILDSTELHIMQALNFDTSIT